MTLAAIMAVFASCAQPFTAPRNTVRFSAGMIASQLGSRSLSTFESIRVQVADETGAEVLNQLVSGTPANDQVVVELERDKSYVLTLTITNRETADAHSRGWVYTTSFLVPSTGDIALDVVLPSLAEWTAFQPVIDEIGKLIGFSGTASTSPMQEAFSDASASSATSGSGTSGVMSWSWQRADSDPATETKVTVTAQSDQVLGTTGYTLLAGSLQEFSSGSTFTNKLDWKLSGGVIASAQAEYTGGSKTSPTFLSATVNGFDFKVEFGQIGSSYVQIPDMGQFGTFFQNDMPQIDVAMGTNANGPSPSTTPTPGTAFAKIKDSMTADPLNGSTPKSASGTSDDGKFSWSWSGTSSSDLVQNITALVDVTLSSPSTATLLAGSSFKQGYETYSGQTGGYTEYNFLVSGASVQSMVLHHFHSKFLWKYVKFEVNGFDMTTNVVTVKVMDGGTLVCTYDAFKGSGFSLQGAPNRPGYIFNGLFKDAGLTIPWASTDTVSTATTLYMKWTSLFSGGDGSSGNPFLIATAQDLYNIRQMGQSNYSYKQSADIDLFGSPWATGWIPIGDMSAGGFAGSYDGNGKVIANLKVNTAASNSAAGLFGMTYSATFKRVNLIAVDINNSSNTSTGALAGFAQNPTIYQCSSSGLIKSVYMNTGGLVGQLSGGGKIEQSSSTALIDTTASNTGGLVGSDYGGAPFYLLDSFFAGSVNSPTIVGSTIAGLVGYGGATTNITRSYVTAAIVANPAPSPDSIANGAGITATGGVFYDYNFTPGLSNIASTTSLSTSSMSTSATFAGWDFVTAPVWKINNTFSYPWLNWQTAASALIPGPMARYTSEGDTFPNLTNSGNGGAGWNGTMNGSSVLTTTIPPKLPGNYQAISFNGTPSNFALLGTHDVGNAFTISAWVRFASISAMQTILSTQTAGGNATAGYTLGYDNALFRFIFQAGPGVGQISGTFAPAISTWYHIAVTKAADGTVKLYLNGKLDGSGTIGAFSSNGTIATGAKVNAGTGYENFSGVIDDLRMYPTDLTPAQVAALF